MFLVTSTYKQNGIKNYENVICTPNTDKKYSSAPKKKALTQFCKKIKNIWVLKWQCKENFFEKYLLMFLKIVNPHMVVLTKKKKNYNSLKAEIKK